MAQGYKGSKGDGYAPVAKAIQATASRVGAVERTSSVTPASLQSQIYALNTRVTNLAARVHALDGKNE